MRATFQDVLNRNKGTGPGFDLMRIGLAFAIFFGHCFFIAGSAVVPAGDAAAAGTTTWAPTIWDGQKQLRLMLVPMFFALSGFLVSGSAFRTKSIKTFLAFRCLRIAPALLTEVTLSALVLGPLLTVVPLARYFSDPAFFAYFGNIVGLVRFELPGLFLDNPVKEIVNVNLWTLPPEFYCYLIIAALIVSGLLFKRGIFTAAFVLASGALIFLTSILGIETGPIVDNRNTLIFYFFTGCLFWHWRDYVPFNLGMFALCAVLSYYLFLYQQRFVAPVFVTYLILYLGLVKFPRIALISSGDYSYGSYLYGFPIAQALVAALPQFRGHGWWLLLAATPLTFAFAVASWHLIEKPTLALKRHIGSSAARRIDTFEPAKTGLIRDGDTVSGPPPMET